MILETQIKGFKNLVKHQGTHKGHTGKMKATASPMASRF